MENIRHVRPRYQFLDPIKEALKQIDRLVVFIIGVMLIGFATLMFMVAGMVIEAWRFNSTIYRESQQLKLQEELIRNTVDQQKLILDNLNIIKEKLDNSENR